jgi:nucleotide-binding universal stress UspA family protein
VRETIICGIDASEEARGAARSAATLAEALRARLVLAHVAQVAVGPEAATVPHAYDRLRKRAHSEAERFVARFARETNLAGRAELWVLFGNPAEALAQAAAEERASLVVMGSRCDGPLRAAVRGSVSRKLVAEAPCPVMVVAPGRSLALATGRAA